MLFQPNVPNWINQQGQIIRVLNQAQQEYVQSPIFLIALALYRTAVQNNLPSAANRLAELNRSINQYADEVEVNEMALA